MEATYFDTITRRYQQQGFFPSAVYRVFDRDSLLFEGRLGDVREGTVFDVASLSKLVVSTQILMLTSRSRLKLDGILADYLPEVLKWDILRERLGQVSLIQLLTHTSGLVDWVPMYAGTPDFYETLALLLPAHPPEHGMVYSDLNFMLLGKVLEAVTGLTLPESLDSLIKKPLGIENMWYCPSPSLDIAPSGYGNPREEEMCRQGSLAFDSFRSSDMCIRGEVHDGNSFYFFHGVAGHAGIFADAKAYETLCRFYLRTEDPLFRQAMCEAAPGRGLGFQISPTYPDGCGHTGFTGTSVYLSGAHNLGMVIFTNRLYHKGEPRDITPYRREMHEAALAIFR